MSHSPPLPGSPDHRSVCYSTRSRDTPSMNSNLPPYVNTPTPGAASGGPFPYSQTAPLPARNSSQHSNNVVVCPPRLGSRSFPNPSDFVGLSPIDHPAIFAEAPWFDPHAVRDDELINRYVVAGRLPDGLPLFAIYTDDWLAHCALPDHAISRFGNETIGQARVRFTKLIYQRLRRVIGTVPLDDAYEFDTWAARTNGEAYAYCDNLEELQTRRWRGLRDVRQEALCFTQPLLRAEFRYLRKRNIPFWENARLERRTRSRMGYLVPYQMVEVDRVRHRARIGRYIPIPNHWAAIEVPRGCAVELPPVLTYLGSHLVNDPYCGLWVVAFMKFIAKMAVYILLDAYDVYRIWYISPLARQYARSLDLSVVLGSRANQDDFRHLLDVMDQVNWDQVPTEQQQRGERRRQREYSPGRTAEAGDLIWYDPWTRQHISTEQAAHLRQNPKPFPPTQPTGYAFEPAPAHVDVLTDEEQQVPYENEPYGMEQDVPVPEDDVAVAPQPVDTDYAMPNEATVSSEVELGIMRRFLEDVGIPSVLIRGDRDGMVQSMKLRLSGQSTDDARFP